jgi:hypothetical protein
MINARDIKRTDFNLAWQHADTIARFNKVLDKKFDLGSAEMLYRLSKLSYKRQFWDFCCRNHLKIVVDDINSEQERYKEWLSNQPEKNIEEPQNYGDATMRHTITHS